MIRSTRLTCAGLLLAVLAACDSDGGPLTPETRPTTPSTVVALDCKVTVKPTATFGCTPSAPTGAGSAAVIVGNQNTYVKLQASNLSNDEGTGIFSFDATVQNLLMQSLGTTNGTTLDPEAIKVFFHQGPTSTGAGSVSVFNATGSDDFTGENQPYFQYDEVLSQNEVSPAKNWQFQVSGGATGFVFKVYVRAQVQYPEGFITLARSRDTLVASDTVKVSATVYNVVNNPEANQSVTWSSSNTGVATVDASGVITAVAPGSTLISAVSGSRTASIPVAVCYNLAVGEVVSTTMPGASNLCIAGGGAGAEFTYMPVNLATSGALSLTVTATGTGAVTGPPSPSLLPGGLPRLNATSDAALQQNEDLHISMMERDLRDVSTVMRKPSSLVRRGARTGGARRNITIGVPTVGDIMNLNTVSGCSGTRGDRAGMVRSVGQHIIIVSDTSNPAGGFTTAQYDSIAMEFDTLVYATDSVAFGAPADLDENGRVIAFYTRAVNELSPPASSSVVAGYFSARDLYSSAPGSCTLSNEGEMFYMLVPDPTGVVNSNVRTVSYVRGGTVGTIAHELQHLTNASRRMYVNDGFTQYESVWLNEGLSHIAEELMFYRASGMSPRQNVAAGTNAVSGIQLNSKRVAAYNTYASANFGRLRTWMQRPDTSGAFKGNDVLATRGAVWAFLRYAADRKNASDATLWYDLSNSQQAGLTNLATVLGVSPQEWVRDFDAAMYTDDAVTGVSPIYTIPSWNFRSMHQILYGSYSLQVRALTSGVPLTVNHSAGGGTTYQRFSVGASKFGKVTALSGGVAPTTPFALSIVRTK
ncbi:Ig-like domain-containing protein [Longimicrobium terrae]|uniref:BIG2 domain-containing protein n=1 Tax=Longimicrobium terrae TaxID=1639882 RepID=A0A841H5F5_9BACT|nr:Ig-like domain-containing protein [Longimicrobium terrae]MBB4638750.1 hypothetical protein [Longimicrobium terrae]MBB6072989.1 hypothetical protein [Longimicrobium terrae]NNC33113.1 hypothetical protein [Longimicrobium terrae]